MGAEIYTEFFTPSCGALVLFEKTMDTVDKRDESVYFRDINKGHGRIEEHENFVM